MLQFTTELDDCCSCFPALRYNTQYLIYVGCQLGALEMNQNIPSPKAGQFFFLFQLNLTNQSNVYLLGYQFPPPLSSMSLDLLQSSVCSDLLHRIHTSARVRYVLGR